MSMEGNWVSGSPFRSVQGIDMLVNRISRQGTQEFGFQDSISARNVDSSLEVAM
jgi:hypothetical protein